MSAARFGDVDRVVRALAEIERLCFSDRRRFHVRGVDQQCFYCVTGRGLGSFCSDGYALDAPEYMAGGACYWFDGAGLGFPGPVGVWVRRGAK